jgi:hypothetical protein
VRRVLGGEVDPPTAPFSPEHGGDVPQVGVERLNAVVLDDAAKEFVRHDVVRVSLDHVVGGRRGVCSSLARRGGAPMRPLCTLDRSKRNQFVNFMFGPASAGNATRVPA